MNKLSKIVLVSSLSILGGVITLGGVVLAQEIDSNQVENSNSDAQESRQINPRVQSRPLERKSLSTESKDMSSQAGEKRSQNIEQRELNIAERTANREQRIKDRCENVGMKIMRHQSVFKSRSQGRIVKYNQVTNRLELVSNRLAEKEVDVTTYNSYISELKAKIADLNNLNQDYIQLFGSKANTGEFCNNKEQLATEVDTRKSKLQLVISKDKEIRMYIKETILPYLKSIKPEENSTESTSSSDESNSSMTTVQ